MIRIDRIHAEFGSRLLWALMLSGHLLLGAPVFAQDPNDPVPAPQEEISPPASDSTDPPAGDDAEVSADGSSSGNSGQGVGNTGLGNQGTGVDPDGSGNAGGPGGDVDGDGLPASDNAQGGNVGTGNEGEGVGNTGPGNQGQGPHQDEAGNAGGNPHHGDDDDGDDPGDGDDDDGDGGGGGDDGDDDDGGSGDGTAFRWDGGDENYDKWTKKRNWDPDYVPRNDGTADLIFDGTLRLTPDMNKDWDINSLTFDVGAGGFTLGSSAGHTLTVRGGGFVNNSPQSQTIDLHIVLGASQSWVANSGGMTFNGNIENSGHTLTLSGPENIAVQGSISGTGGLVKSGSGTAILGGANSFTGGVVINQGTLLLGASDRIADTVDMTLAGGRLAMGDSSESLATLTLTSSSTIDFSGSSSVLSFADSSGQSWDSGSALSVVNWDGLWTGGGAEQIYFGSTASGLSAGQLAQIQFVNPTGMSGNYPATLLPSGELVPLIPESPALVAVFLLAGLAVFRERHRLLRKREGCGHDRS